MTSVYFTTPLTYPSNQPFSSFPTTRINDIEHQTIFVPTVSQRKPRNGLRLLCMALSIFTNLIFLSLITWIIFTQYDILVANLDIWTPRTSGSAHVNHKTICRVDLSSAMCIPCQNTPEYLLWQGKFVRVLTGNSALCCRKIDHSLALLFKEMKNVQLVSQRKNDKSSPVVNSYYVHLQSGAQLDLGTLPLTRVSETTSSNYRTKITVEKPGWYKIIAEVTTSLNRQDCPAPSRNFVRVVSEDPRLGRRTLLQKNWACPENITSKLINPVQLMETFYFSRDTFVYVEVSNRAQIYKFLKSNYVGLV